MLWALANCFPQESWLGEDHTTFYSKRSRTLAKPIEISGVCPCRNETDVGKLSDACRFFFVLRRHTRFVAVM